MEKAHNPSTDRDSELPPQAQRRAGYFARFLDALHESRRRQAGRYIRHYRHLLADPPEGETPWIAHRDIEPGVLREPAAESRPVRWRPAVGTLAAVIVLGFGILHLIGGSIIQRVSAHHAAETAVLPAQGD